MLGSGRERVPLSAPPPYVRFRAEITVIFRATFALVLSYPCPTLYLSYGLCPDAFVLRLTLLLALMP